MQSSKLISLLKTLGPWQLKAFEKYVSSPFFNVNENVLCCQKALLLHHPEYAELSEKKLFAEVFGKKSFHHQSLRYIMTDLTRLLENFLIYDSLQSDPFLQKQLLLKKLKSSGLEKYFNQQAVQATQLLNTEKKRISDYKQKHALDEIAFEFNRNLSGRNADNNLQELSDSMDAHYLIARLKYSCEMLNRQNVLSEKYHLPSLPFLNALINEVKFNDPLITVYIKIFELLQNYHEEKRYHDLKKSLLNHIAEIDVEELRDIYVFRQNYCIRMINEGQEDFLQELFDIYVEMIDNEIIFEKNILEHHQFKNIVTLALRLDKVEWVEQFINKQQHRLNKDLRKNAVSYNTARVNYAKGKYRDALRIMRTVEFTDVYYHLDAKILLLKIYYETQDFEPLLSMITSTRTYLKRSKLISDYQRGIYINLLNYIRKMTRYKAGEKVDIQSIHNELLIKKDIADISWLKLKLAEII